MIPLSISELENRCYNSAQYAWINGNRYCGQLPSFMYISLTNICNYKCYMCGHKTLMRKKRGYMKFDTFKLIIDKLPYSVDRLWLMKQGETTIISELEKYLKYAKDRRPDVRLMLATNGSALSNEMCHILIDNLDYLDVGLHSIKEITYRKITTNGNFDNVLNNLRYLDKNIDNDKFTYNITYVRQSLNKEETDEDILNYFRKELNNYNNIVIKWESNFGGEIEEANLKIYNNAKQIIPRCMLPYTCFTILFDGNISYCGAEARENYFVGNILDEDFDNIWNGEKMQTFREKVVNNERDYFLQYGIQCAMCTWPWSYETQNPELLVSKENKELLKFNMNRVYSAEEYAKKGLILYLNSKYSDAFECFNIASSIRSKHYNIKDLCRKWMKEIKNYYCIRYQNIEKWEEKLNSENMSFSYLTRKIYSNTKNNFAHEG